MDPRYLGAHRGWREIVLISLLTLVDASLVRRLLQLSDTQCIPPCLQGGALYGKGLFL